MEIEKHSLGGGGHQSSPTFHIRQPHSAIHRARMVSPQFRCAHHSHFWLMIVHLTGIGDTLDVAASPTYLHTYLLTSWTYIGYGILYVVTYGR